MELVADLLARLRHSEVEDLHHELVAVLLAAHEQVFRLDVPVHDAESVGLAQAMTSVGKDSRRGAGTQASASSQQVLQVLPLEVLHGDVQAAVVVGSEVEDIDDMRTADLGGGSGFDGEPRTVVVLVSEGGIDELHGDWHVEGEMLG
jgi:hypothetical protein